MPWRLILSPASDGPANMAMDEALLTRCVSDAAAAPIIRLYSWTEPCITIGYFQMFAVNGQDKVPITRRLTGGLTVVHGNDLSYAMIAKETAWPWLYDQTETYRRMHAVIKNILADRGLGIDSAITTVSPSGNARCVETIYTHDVLHNGRKIVGSCMRRRGNTILLQGSIHLPSIVNQINEIRNGFEMYFPRIVNDTMTRSKLVREEHTMQRALMETRYATSEWNEKY